MLKEVSAYLNDIQIDLSQAQLIQMLSVNVKHKFNDLALNLLEDKNFELRMLEDKNYLDSIHKDLTMQMNKAENYANNINISLDSIAIYVEFKQIINKFFDQFNLIEAGKQVVSIPANTPANLIESTINDYPICNTTNTRI